jgi:hypothetical protein
LFVVAVSRSSRRHHHHRQEECVNNLGGKHYVFRSGLHCFEKVVLICLVDRNCELGWSKLHIQQDPGKAWKVCFLPSDKIALLSRLTAGVTLLVVTK